MMQSNLIPKWILVFIITVAALGFVDSTYLTIEHYTNSNPPCFVGSCELVLTSAYSAFMGIPVALFGILYYLAILVGMLIYFEAKKERAFWMTLKLTSIGFLGSLYFFILQAFVIHAFCQYCLASAVTSTTLFVTSIIIYWKSKKHSNSTSLPMA